MSEFYDDIARGCLPTGEPLECLYGVGWWTEEDEPDPAELEALVERLIEAGDRLSDSLCIDPEEEKTVEVCNWNAIVAEYKERER